MPKTGIITFHHVPNFGAFIQAWSLVQAIKGLGREVEVIDYRPAGHDAKFRRKGWRGMIPSLGGWRMTRFMKSHLPLSPTVRSAAEVDALVDSGRYDTLVCGSDQVWLKDGFLGFDRVYFLGIGQAANVRRVSYAPSAGSIDSYGEDSEEARKRIGALDAVSVRDENAMKLVTSLGITGVQRVVDPSLLADFSELIGRRPIEREYVAVTGRMNSAAERFAREAADALAAELVSLGTRCSTADVERRYVHAGEWVTGLAHARLVVTSLFHGAAVSIGLRKPFIALDAAGRAFKLTDLLGRFGISERFVPEEDGRYRMDKVLFDLDYSRVEPAIERDVEASWGYLRRALNG